MRKQIRPRIYGDDIKAYDNIFKEELRILAIGDLHEPFTLNEYLKFCLDTYAKYRCNKVIFIGDIIDNHYASYHETDPDGFGGSEELELAIKNIRKWSKAFPVADVVIGNHDRLIMRKAFSSAIPKKWIKSYNDVLGVNWKWSERFVYDDVQYIHGEGPTARAKAKNDMMSTVQGHRHSEIYTDWIIGSNKKIFGVQVGCGVDEKSYALSYAKNHRKQAIGCAVIIGGHTAINCLM